MPFTKLLYSLSFKNNYFIENWTAYHGTNFRYTYGNKKWTTEYWKKNKEKLKRINISPAPVSPDKWANEKSGVSLSLACVLYWIGPSPSPFYIIRIIGNHATENLKINAFVPKS